jgi:tetratricopeptide (TPR) repeat protein
MDDDPMPPANVPGNEPAAAPSPAPPPAATPGGSPGALEGEPPFEIVIEEDAVPIAQIDFKDYLRFKELEAARLAGRGEPVAPVAPALGPSAIHRSVYSGFASLLKITAGISVLAATAFIAVFVWHGRTEKRAGEELAAGRARPIDQAPAAGPPERSVEVAIASPEREPPGPAGSEKRTEAPAEKPPEKAAEKPAEVVAEKPAEKKPAEKPAEASIEVALAPPLPAPAPSPAPAAEPAPSAAEEKPPAAPEPKPEVAASNPVSLPPGGAEGAGAGGPPPAAPEAAQAAAPPAPEEKAEAAKPTAVPLAPKAPPLAAPPAASDLFAQALSAQEKGDLARARTLYEQYLEEHPTSPFALNNYALICAHDGNPEKALTLLKEALALDPDFADADVNLGNLHLAGGEADLAELDYRAALKAKPEHPVARYDLALLLSKTGGLDEAERLLEKLVAAGPGASDGEAHALLGRVLLRRGNLPAARAALERALALDATLAAAETDLGVVRLEQGDLEAARATFDRVIARKPDYAPAFNNRGNVRVAEGKIEEAKVDYERALEIDPSYADAHYNYALLAERFGNYLYAIEEYHRVLEIDPKNARAMNNLGLIYRRGKKPADALRLLDQAVATAPDLAEAHYNRALALLDLGRKVEAAGAFERYVALQPEGSEKRRAIMETLAKLKDAVRSRSH